MRTTAAARGAQLSANEEYHAENHIVPTRLVKFQHGHVRFLLLSPRSKVLLTFLVPEIIFIENPNFRWYCLFMPFPMFVHPAAFADTRNLKSQCFAVSHVSH